MRRNAVLAGIATLAAAAGLMAFDLNPAASQTTMITALRSPNNPGLDPDATAWDDAQEVAIPLAAQAITYPLGGGSTSEVRVRALQHGGELFVRVTWDDSSHNAATHEVGQFTDAAAVQFPAVATSSVPAVCMGQADGGVNIWQWRADHDVRYGRWPDSQFPNGYVDEYPPGRVGRFPALDVGNPVARRDVAAQDLVAQGFGTLGKAANQRVRAHGTYATGDPADPATWTVVFRRPLSKPGPGQPGFAVRDTVDVAFAVWDGEEGERNGVKSVSAFARLVLSKDSQPTPSSQGWWLVLVPMAVALYGAWRLIRTPRASGAKP